MNEQPLPAVPKKALAIGSLDANAGCGTCIYSERDSAPPGYSGDPSALPLRCHFNPPQTMIVTREVIANGASRVQQIGQPKTQTVQEMLVAFTPVAPEIWCGMFDDGQETVD